MLKISLFVLSYCFIQFGQAQSGLHVKDITMPESSKTDALCGPLHMVTMATGYLDSIELFYVKGMGMNLVGPFSLTKKDKKQQKEMWDLASSFDYSLYLLQRPNVPENIQIRVMLVSKKIQPIHKSYSSREMGPFSLGFPNANQEGLDTTLRSLGFNSMAPMQAAILSKPDGTKYKYLETIYKAPEFVHAVGIERGNGMPQLAPYDSLSLKGGPGYAAQVVTGISKSVLNFYTEVLGMEIRKDTEWRTGEGSALGIEPNIPFRFAIVYAKGATSGHLLFIDFKDNKKLGTNTSPKLPNRGIGMYSFETKSIRQVYNRAKDRGVPIIQPPIDYKDPMLGSCRIMTMIAPNGVMIEVFQRK